MKIPNIKKDNIVVLLASTVAGGVSKVTIDQIEHWIDKSNRTKEFKAVIKKTNKEFTELKPVYDETILDKDSIMRQCKTVNLDFKSAVSPIIATAIQDGIISNHGRNLLECVNIPTDMLHVWKDNPNIFHGYQMKDGHFYKQGKFVSASFPTPLLVFQITSLVTGLYFQNQISEQLSIINKKLDFLINNIFQKDYSIIQSNSQWINEVNQLENFKPEDISSAEQRLEELNRLRCDYRQKFEKIDFSINYLVGSNYSEIKKWRNAFSESYMLEIMEIAYAAEVEYLLVNILISKMYSNYDTDYYKERLVICAKRHNPNFYIFYAPKYYELKKKMEINLNGLENKAEYKNDTITNIKNEIMDNFSNIENKFSKVSSLGPRQYMLIENGECIGVYTDIKNI